MYKEPKPESITIRITTEQKKEITRRAEEEDRAPASWLYLQIVDILERVKNHD